MSDSYCATAVESHLLALINAYRQLNERGPLLLSPTLGAAARHHAASMAEGGYFSHTLRNPDGSLTTWRQNILAHGYPERDNRNLTVWLQNILTAGQASPADALARWGLSYSHNAAILDKRAQAIGIGHVADLGSRYRVYWVACLGSVVDDCACAVVVG